MQAIGASRGGLSTKIHMSCDALGNPLRFILTPGQISDYTPAQDLIADFPTQAVLADKGYDSNAIINAIHKSEAEAVIPPKANRVIQRDCDYALYKERNLVERLFNRLKQYRGLATRYCKCKTNFLGFLYLAATMIWLK